MPRKLNQFCPFRYFVLLITTLFFPLNIKTDQESYRESCINFCLFLCVFSSYINFVLFFFLFCFLSRFFFFQLHNDIKTQQKLYQENYINSVPFSFVLSFPQQFFPATLFFHYGARPQLCAPPPTYPPLLPCHVLS